jgi:hypothetical protein
MFHLGIDEYNTIIDLVDLNNHKKGRSKLVEIVRDIQLAMKHWAEYGIMITTFFTGTRIKDMRDIFVASFGICTPVYSSPLSFEESCKIVSDVAHLEIPIKLVNSLVHKTLPKEELLSNARLQVISLLGGIPRCIEVFIQSLAMSKVQNMSTLVNSVLIEISLKYSFSRYNHDLFYKILGKCIRQEIVGADEIVVNKTLDQHQAEGLLMLERFGDQYKIVLPFLWLWHFSNELSKHDKYPAASALRTTLGEALTGEWEKLGAYYWTALTLFFYEKNGGITYRQLAQGATFIPNSIELDNIIPMDYNAIKRTVVSGVQVTSYQFPDTLASFSKFLSYCSNHN